MITFENRDSVAKAAAFRLGLYEELDKPTNGSKMVVAAGKVDRGKAFYVLRFTGWPDEIDNGWQLISAPDRPEWRRLIEGMIRANFTTAPIVKPFQKTGRN